MVMHGGAVGNAAHGAAQSVYFAHDLPFGYAADGGIAGHLGNCVQALRQQQGVGPRFGRGQSRLTACVAAADYNDVIDLRIFVHLLPHAKLGKNNAQYVVRRRFAGQIFQRAQCPAQMLRAQLQPRPRGQARGGGFGFRLGV